MSDIQLQAKALLENARHTMTGREMEVCEKAAQGERISRREEEPERTDEGTLMAGPESDMRILQGLFIQHCVELPGWVDALR